LELSKKRKWKNTVEKNSVPQQEEVPTGGRTRGRKCLMHWYITSRS